MKFYTAHLRPGRQPVLVREGFSWGALLFGPFWLLSHGAWVTAVLVASAETAIFLLAHGTLGLVLGLWMAWLVGLLGRDMIRWHLAHRGYGEPHVIAARDEAAALGRLLAVRPDQVGAGL